MFDFVVIGKGLMGSAAARYLSVTGARVGVIGPDEPTAVADHDGIFASHYDQGRITRLLSRDLVWAELAHRAIQQYATLEAASGISFYHQCGCLFVTAPGLKHKYGGYLQQIGQSYPVTYQHLTADQSCNHHPFFGFASACTFIWETSPAGYVNPREMLRAQLAVAQQQGAEVVRETAVSLQHHTGHITINTKEGNSYHSRQVLLAMGAYANCFGLLPRALDLYVKTEQIVLAEVAADEVTRLSDMPAVIYQAELGRVSGFYMLPPIVYPDGRYYIKMGCDTLADQKMHTYQEIQTWMRHGDSEAMLPDMQTAVLAMLPGLQVQSWHTRRCLITRTCHQKPFIGAVDDGRRLFVVTGGNGTSAKSSDAIGQLAARLMLHNGAWVDELEQDLFQVVWQ